MPCIYADDLTPQQIKAFRIADNKTGEIADWDFDLLEQELQELLNGGFDLDSLGFNQKELDEIIAKTVEDMDYYLDLRNGDDDTDEEEEENEIEEDEVPEIDEENEPITKLGDIWQLGRHRLMCGDSTDKATVEKLMNGAKADMVFTDPPYNVAFNGRSGNFDVIENDNLSNDEFETFINATIDIIKHINAPIYYIWCNWKFYGILQGKLDYKACIVWAKNVFGLGVGYRHQHEFCLFNGEIDNSIKNESDLWEVAKDTNYVHPTQKPVALICRALKNHKDVKTVLDLFGGSGSSLIGCEQLDRICYTMELDPKYCDVIIKRWETLTGEKAELIERNE